MKTTQSRSTDFPIRAFPESAPDHARIENSSFAVFRLLALSACCILPIWATLPTNADDTDVSPDRPNILLIVTDDQGYWDLGVHGNEKIDTPRLDHLAAESVQFNRYYVQPVCAPTRAGLMTGRYYLRSGLYNTRFGGDSLGLGEVTVAQLLHQAGYRTGLFGKWHLGRYAGYRPHERGFDEFLGHYNGHIEEYDYPNQLVQNGDHVQARGYVTNLFTDAALDFIEAGRDQPFFCYVAYNAPHSPYVVGASHDRMPEGDELISKYLARDLPLREARICAMCEIIDSNVGRLLDRLDELDLSRSTVVLFQSDNGGVSRAFKAGLRGGKGSVFEGGVRSPLFIRWPGRFAPNVCDSLASHVDLLPTFCELAGTSIPDDRAIDGRSLLPLLSGESTEPIHDFVFYTWDRYQPNPYTRWAVSGARYKLCANGATGDMSPDWFLFDLENDPGEKHNIADQHPEIVRQLRPVFEDWFGDVTGGREYRPVPIPVGHPSENPVEIQASWAALQGETVNYTFRGYDWDTIDAWNAPGDSAAWQLDVNRDGEYEVTVIGGCRQSDAGSVLRLSCGNESLMFSPHTTTTADVFVPQVVGQLSLTAGKASLSCQVESCPGQEAMRLNRILLRRIESE